MVYDSLCTNTTSNASRTTPVRVDRQVYFPASDRLRSVKARVDVSGAEVDTPAEISPPAGPNHWMVGEPLTPTTVQVREYVSEVAGTPIVVMLLIVYSSKYIHTCRKKGKIKQTCIKNMHINMKRTVLTNCKCVSICDISTGYYLWG